MGLRPKRFVPVRLVQSQHSEFSSAFTKVSSGTVPFRSVALLPILLPRLLGASAWLARALLWHTP